MKSHGNGHARLALIAVMALLIASQFLRWQPSEPFFNNDETRHVMTGVYFRDLLHDMPLTHLREYTVRYYRQYPALALLVWPPLFHMVEGALMLLFGVSFTVSRILSLAFGLVACIYMFRLVRRTHDLPRAILATLFLGFGPLVFFLSTRAMLEVPMLAFFLAANFYFMRHLDESRRSDLWKAAGAAALAMLTRYDGALTLPFLALLALVRGQGRALVRPATCLAALAALAVASPFYAVAWKEIGWLHAATISGSLPAGYLPLASLARAVFYPRQLPGHVGPWALGAGLVGLALSLRPTRIRSTAPYLLLLAFTYVVFTPVMELEPRHVIFWFPAWALFASEAAWILPGVFRLPAAAALLLVQAAATLAPAPAYVRGYEEAAGLALRRAEGARYILFDGKLEGAFIYQVRRLDPARATWVVRGDRLLYTALDGAPAAYREIAHSDSEVVSLLTRCAPAVIVVEDPGMSREAPMAKRLREVLRQRADCYRLDNVVPIYSARTTMGGRLLIYTNVCRSPEPEGLPEMDVPELRRGVHATVPVKKE